MVELNASEVIERLQELVELHGDLNVGISIWDNECYFHRCADAHEVDYDPHYKEFCIKE